MILRRKPNWHSCTRAASKADGGMFLIFHLTGIMGRKIQRYKAHESGLRVFMYVKKGTHAIHISTVESNKRLQSQI